MSESQLWSLSQKNNFAPSDLTNKNSTLNFISFRKFAMDRNINSSSCLDEDYYEPLLARIDG